MVYSLALEVSIIHSDLIQGESVVCSRDWQKTVCPFFLHCTRGTMCSAPTQAVLQWGQQYALSAGHGSYLAAPRVAQDTLYLKSSRKILLERQNSLLQKYRRNPGGKKPFVCPEILAGDSRSGWKSDKLLPPAVGSFSATKAPANAIPAASRNCRSLVLERKREERCCAVYPKSGQALLRPEALVPVPGLLAFSATAFLPCSHRSVRDFNA